MDKQIYILGRDSVPEVITLDTPRDLGMILVALPGTSLRQRLEIDIQSPGCEVELRGVFLCTGQEQLGFDILVRHSSGGSTSRQLFKGIAGGSSHTEFNGLIYVAHDAQKTKAWQENHTLLVTPEAVASAKPQLEIYADDVECSHGATTGFLDEMEQFYMRSRGVPEAEARKLQMISFLSPVLSDLPEGLRDELINSL